jgi:acyl-CoA synthetase (AMP-forming)/AMP-acid ligase II
VPVGEVGEIWIAGPGVSAGYLNRPELTGARFVTRRSAGDIAVETWPTTTAPNTTTSDEPTGARFVTRRSAGDIAVETWPTTTAPNTTTSDEPTGRCSCVVTGSNWVR